MFAVIRGNSFSNSGVKMAVEILRLTVREIKPSSGFERFWNRSLSAFLRSSGVSTSIQSWSWTSTTFTLPLTARHRMAPETDGSPAAALASAAAKICGEQ